jgi:hypothetical protein
MDGERDRGLHASCGNLSRARLYSTLLERKPPVRASSCPLLCTCARRIHRCRLMPLERIAYIST